MTVSILGCGWFGKALAGSLIEQGINVKGSATSEDKLAALSALGLQPYRVHFDPDSETYDPGFFDCDVLVVSIPPKFKQGGADDYFPKINRIIDAIKNQQVAKVIYISTTGVYDEDCGEVTEQNAPQPTTQTGNILLEAEKLFQHEQGFKTTVVRFAGLVGPNRNPGRFFAGKTNIPNGQAPINLIHLDDCVGIVTAIIQKEAFGYVFNASSPDHPSKSKFYRQAATQAGLPLPEFIDELKAYKIISSSLLSSVLSYSFKVPVWENCFFD